MHQPPTLNQTVAAVQGADTPAQGRAAYNVVVEYLGLSTEYATIPAADAQEITDFYGAAIAEDNATPIPRTFSDIIDTLEEQGHVVVVDADVMTAARAAIQDAQSGVLGVNRDDLLLLAALDGTNVQPNDHLSPIGGLAFARWFAQIYIFPTFLAQTKAECLALCKKSYDNRLIFLWNSYQTSLANVRAILARQGKTNPQLEQALRNIYDRGVERAKFDYDLCTKRCHEQS